MNTVRRLCVYCGSSSRVRTGFLDIAFRFGQLLAHENIELVYGGGRAGMMGKLADGCLSDGGRVIGIIPNHLHELEVAHTGVSEFVLVETMHQRKQQMAERADAFAILPGGFGTLDEMFEIVTWRQLGLHDKPIVLANLEHYWDHLQSAVALMMEEGFVTKATRFYEVVDTIEAIVPALEAARPPIVKIEAHRF